MVESLVWNKKSILNIDKDTMYESTGTATVSDKSLVLGARSSTTYDYTFDTNNNTLETSNLKFILYVINSNTTVSSRYDESVQVETYIKYYEKQVDNSGNITGYIHGNTDTYQINPYFKHESEGYTDTYEVSIENNYIVELKIKFINNSDNTVTFVKPRVFNSMSVKDAIDEYISDSGGNEPAPPQFNDLVLYSLDEKYTIDKMDGSLRLKVYIPDEYINKYKHEYTSLNTRDIDVNYSFTRLSGDILFSKSYKNIGQEFTLEDGTKSTVDIKDGEIAIASIGGNGVAKVRVELSSDNTVYAEKNIKVTNNNVTDMQLILDSASGKIDDNKVYNGRIKILPETTRTETVVDDIEMKVTSYDGGDAYVIYGDKKLSNGVIPFEIIGRKNGKVKLTVTTARKIDYNYQRLFPIGFTKEFIIDVVNVTGSWPIFVDTPDGTVLDNKKEYIDLIVTSNYGGPMELTSFSVQSLDDNGKAVASKIKGEGTKIILRIYALNIGKVKVIGHISNLHVLEDFDDYFEQEIDITGLYKELTTEITTNTGLFEITQGGGQLEVHCMPNFPYDGDYSFSQASIDGGSVDINDKGNYALITADKEGKLNLICTPTYGKSAQCEISISGQYPEDVKLTCADNIFKVPINGSLMIYAEPGNKPNSLYNKYSWATEKLDADVGFSIVTGNTNCKCTGEALGKFRLNTLRYIDGKFMTSQVIKVVQSLDSDKTVLTLPNEAKYWVVYRRVDQGNRLWLLTIDDTVTLNKLIKKTDNELYTDNININKYAQWKIESGQWANYSSWTSGDTHIASNVSIIYASNIDIYNEDGNLLVAKTDNYDDVDFDAIIYG